MWFQAVVSRGCKGTRFRSHVGSTGGAKAKQEDMALMFFNNMVVLSRAFWVQDERDRDLLSPRIEF
jgi:hypothetical protein